MEIQLSGPDQASPKALVIIGVVLFFLGCIWPVIALGDFTDELEAQSWDTVDATVVQLEIEEYTYECGDSESGSSTCTDYYANYMLQYAVDGITYSHSDEVKVSHFESRVWEVDYPKNSIREIAYDSEDPNNIDIDQGNFAPFIPPVLVFLFSTFLASLCFIGAFRAIFNPREPVNPDEESDIPYSDEPLHFASAKNVWGELHFAHPSVEALARKMKSYSCTDAQIDEFFSMCKKQQNDPNNPKPLSRNWLVKIEEVVENHESMKKSDLTGNILKGRIVIAGLGVVLLLLSLVVAVPIMIKYGALPWYGWALAAGTLGSIGLTLALTKMAHEMAKFADQGLGEMLVKFADEELYGYHED